MKANTKRGFTLVELIVGIAILAILWTLAFIYFWGYTQNARDGTRRSDTANIGTSVELFLFERGRLPEPSNAVNITYSWATVITQGTFWESAFRNVWQLSKKPLDPLYENEYTYSVNSTKNSYNLWYIQEGQLTFSPPLIQSAYAANQSEVVGKVSGSYNGQIAHTSTWGVVYVFAIPSLILTDVDNEEILDTSDKYVYEYESNIPASYKGTDIIQAWEFQYTPKLVYSGSTLPRTPASLKILVEGVQDALIGTRLYSKPEYKEVLELDTSDANQLFEYGDSFINKQLWGRFSLTYPKNCKQILTSEDNRWSGSYTISPNGFNKIDVHCDMETDGWGWTRIRAWDRTIWYTDLKTIIDTAGINGSEVMTKYTRYGKIRKNIGWVWQDVDVSGKQYWLYYTRFKTKQTQESWLCGEHLTVKDLASQITSGTWWDCSRSCQRTDPNDPSSPCDYSLEYTNIQLDDLWANIWLPDDKQLEWFDPDPCVTNGQKTTARNVSWNSNGMVNHRIDTSTSLISLWGTTTSRCNGTYWWQTRLNNRGSSRRSARGISNIQDYLSWFQTNEVYVR